MKKTKVGILGYGEIGKAVAQFYKSKPSFEIKVKDRVRDDGLEGIKVLHVCLPWIKDFESVVVKEVSKNKPDLTVIHSTIAPGTTKRIIKKLPKKLQNVVHSPVRGIHPHLYKGMKTFVTYIGAENRKSALAAQRHLRKIGMKTRSFLPAASTELGKLLDTTYYGLCIAWHGEMKKMCDKLGVDFARAVTDFNETYNEGYIKLGKKNVVRPVLYPPKGGIGGHCVVPNAKILNKMFSSEVLKLVLRYSPKSR